MSAKSTFNNNVKHTMTHSSSSIRISLAGLLFRVVLTTEPSLAVATEPPGNAEVKTNTAFNWKMYVIPPHLRCRHQGLYSREVPDFVRELESCGGGLLFQ